MQIQFFQSKRKNYFNLLMTDNIVKFNLQLHPQMKNYTLVERDIRITDDPHQTENKDNIR